MSLRIKLGNITLTFRGFIYAVVVDPTERDIDEFIDIAKKFSAPHFRIILVKGNRVESIPLASLGEEDLDKLKSVKDDLIAIEWFRR